MARQARWLGDAQVAKAERLAPEFDLIEFPFWADAGGRTERFRCRAVSAGYNRDLAAAPDDHAPTVDVHTLGSPPTGDEQDPIGHAIRFDSSAARSRADDAKRHLAPAQREGPLVRSIFLPGRRVQELFSMKLGLHQSARMEQRLLQSPQMIQAMQILQLSAADLEERIEHELTENPFLELKEGGEAEPGGEGESEAAQGRSNAAENALAELEALERDRRRLESPRSSYDGEADKKLEAMQNTPDHPKSMAGALLGELSLLDLDAREHAIAEQLVFSLDQRGYLTRTLEEVAAECGQVDVQVDDVSAVLETLRRSTHPALGARDLRESLLLQLGPPGEAPDLVWRMVSDHLDDIVTNRLPRIAKATGASMAEVNEALQTIRSLDPSPGADYGDERAAAITPDVIVEEIDGRAEVRLNRERVPALTLTPAYRELLKQAKRGDGAREWVKKRLESARWFLEAVAQRQSTLLRIAKEMFARQRGFLERGAAGMAPMRMQEIADQVGVHISTVSRAVSGKYVQTPRGTYALKFFFTGGTQTEGGDIASQASIQQTLAELVAQEDPKNPLSDDQLAELLEQRAHVKIARRTVTKYRKALSIPASVQRRVY